MSTQAVFDSKFNIVAVDPDQDKVIQIPGTEFQAPSTKELYEKISIIPNYEESWDKYSLSRAEKENYELRGYPLVIGVGLKNEVDIEDNINARNPQSYRMRLSDLHVGWQYNDKDKDLLTPEFDKYFTTEGWGYNLKNPHYHWSEDHNMESHHVYPVKTIKCDKEGWKNEGLTWNNWNGYGGVNYLAFNIEICKGKEVFADITSGTYDLDNEPIGSIYTLPVRLHWDALKN